MRKETECIFFTSTVGISNIEWISGSQIVAVGPNLTDALPGIYSIRMVSDLGCKATKDMEILADIRPRNGISRNGDSQNDYFHIDFIDQFESNNVKIFNRAGTLVYEAETHISQTSEPDCTSTSKILSLVCRSLLFLIVHWFLMCLL